jgi:arginyl-tRNA synthetase
MQKEIASSIQTALKEIGIDGVDFVVEYPTDKNADADYYSNVAMQAAKQAGKPPQTVAEQLRTVLSGTIPMVETIVVAGPGFLNFSLARSFFTNELERAIAAGTDWGKNKQWAGKRVLVEYTDPNPFKEFHIGHMFTNVVGESIARLFMMHGADTKRINYQGDVGLHVAHALWGIRKLESVTGDAKSLTLTPEVLGKAYALGATA